MKKRYTTPQSTAYCFSPEGSFLVESNRSTSSISFTTDSSLGVTNEKNIFSKKSQLNDRTKSIWE